MAKVVILGAGFSGQTAALYLRKELGKDHDVIVINPWPRFTYIPSLVWVGIGQMARRILMQLSREMKPTKRTLFIRKCVIYQLFRFLVLNFSILKTALLPPHHKH